MIFLDTSIYVAASLQAHERHAACFQLLRTAVARRKSMGCGAHSLSELYSVLTRLPPPGRLSPADAIAIVERIASYTTLFTLSPEEQLAVIRDIAGRRLVSGIIHDAVLLACARKAKAKAIYTLNPRHFLLVAPDLADRIREP